MKGLQFDVEMRLDGLRIYARLGHDIVGALDVDNLEAGNDVQMRAAVIYVAPRWRGNGVARALREFLVLHVGEAPCLGAPCPGT